MELGVKVCILEDQHRFILHHQVMAHQSDDQVAVSMVWEAKKRFKNLNACSFDKGFHTQENQHELKEHLEQVVLPRKGKLSSQAQGATAGAFAGIPQGKAPAHGGGVGNQCAGGAWPQPVPGSWH